MKRTCLQKDTSSVKQNSCEFHQAELSFKERIFDLKDNLHVKIFLQMKKSILFFILLGVFTIAGCNLFDDEGGGVKKPKGESGTFTDVRDGNVYKTIKIGDQTWMAENLAYLPEVYPPDEGSEKDGYYSHSFYYVYDFLSSDVELAKETENYKKYGVLYNWNAALTACPAGWHLPSDAEWDILDAELGDYKQSILKANSGWHNDGNGTNSTGFSALPAGSRDYYQGTFYNITSGAFWWSSDDDKDYEFMAWYRDLTYSDVSNLGRAEFYKSNGFSVRCIKD